MVLGNAKKLAILAMMAGTFAAGEAMAADVTDVLDAADEVYLGNEKVSDPFDIALTPKFVQRLEWAKLKREYNDNGNIRLLNELQYERVVNEFDIDLEIGMFHDLAFRMHMPIIISDQQSYKFDTSSDKEEYRISDTGTQMGNKITGISTLAPAQTTAERPYKFFDLKAGENLKGTERSGLGDMSFGIAWSPYNTERHFIPERPWENNTGRSTVTLAFDYFAPTGNVTKIDNDGVGSGVHQFLFTVAASHRFSFVDPYIRLQYGLPVGTDDAYKDYGGNQKRVDPGMWGRIDLGIEFIPYESIDVKWQRFVKIDLRGYFKYTGEGRAYSEISDALGTSSCMGASAADALSANSPCGWIASKWSNGGSTNDVYKSIMNGTFNGTFNEDGLFDYEGYARVGGAVNLTIQPLQYLQIIAGVSIDYAQNHFITFTKIGVDRITVKPDGSTAEGKDTVVTDNRVEERNPTFSGALDRVGQRIKRTESLNVDWFVGLKLMY